MTIGVFTNCERITLFLNGRAIETKKVERFDAPQFTLPFEPGVLSVEGVRGGVTLKDELVTSGKTAQVRVTPILTANRSADIAIYELNAYDENGVFCPLASDEVEIGIENGRIVGVGNGDPSSMDAEQNQPREKAIFLRSFNGEQGVYHVPEKAANTLRKRYDWLEMESGQNSAAGFEDDYRIVARFGYTLTAAKQKEYTAWISCAEKYEYIEFERLGSRAEVFLNGEKIGDNARIHGRQANNAIRPYRFYGSFMPGENEVRVVALHDESDPPAISGYVKVGKREAQPWKVRLHYGKARVFVKTTATQETKLYLNTPEC